MFAISVLTRAQAQDVELSNLLFSSVLSEDKMSSDGGQVNCMLREPEHVTKCDTAGAKVTQPLTL